MNSTFQIVITVENGAAKYDSYFPDGSNPPSLLEELGALDIAAFALRRDVKATDNNAPEPEAEVKPISTWASIKAWFRS